jgi:spore photoproduct lyase
MIETIYLEEAVYHHPRTKAILSRFPKARKIVCGRYGEVFNPKNQNFRLQKKNPALILAEKHRNFIQPAPANYGIGARRNYYFSHMLNCLYDCRYCFLQGMYQSAHYVLFVNYEDFQRDILLLCEESPSQDIHFFSGYDCDSLALEPVTGFAEDFLPFFAGIANAWLELRTKSTQIRQLTGRLPIPGVIVAFSLSPQGVIDKVEAKTPSLARRLAAIRALQEQGWQVGLRFDPLIYQTDYLTLYEDLFEQVFAVVDAEHLHSVSLGVFRLPEAYFKKMQKLYPLEKLFAAPFQQSDGMLSYRADIEQAMREQCSERLLKHVPPEIFFPCTA